MTEPTRFAYAGARMQARYGNRPARSAWSQITRIGDFGHLLQALRTSPLAPWISNLTTDSGVHRIESELREHFRGEVNELAGWLPRSWRDAAAWMQWLPDLPAVAHVRRSRPPYPWMQDDRILAALGRARAPGTTQGMALKQLLDAPDDGRPVTAHWLDFWHARWASIGGRRRVALQQVDRLSRYTLPPSAPDEDTEAGLHRLFRRHTREPAGAFAYALLSYLQFVRLRGVLLRSRLFRIAA